MSLSKNFDFGIFYRESNYSFSVDSVVKDIDRNNINLVNEVLKYNNADIVFSKIYKNI